MIMHVKIDVEIPDAQTVEEAKEIVEQHFHGELTHLVSEWGIRETGSIYITKEELKNYKQRPR